MNKHTPGPWDDAAITDTGIEILTQDGIHVASTVLGRKSEKEDYANARLIAAAPQQHELLIDALDLVPRINGDDPMAPALVAWCMRAKAAIAKVEGK